MVSQHKLISQPRAYVSPSSQSSDRLATCICLSFIFNAMHRIHLFELSPAHHYCEFKLEVLELQLKKKILLLFNLSLSPTPSHTPLLFWLTDKTDCFCLVPNRWGVLRCSPWLANHCLPCRTPDGLAWPCVPKACVSIYGCSRLQVSHEKCSEPLRPLLAFPNATSQSSVVVTVVCFYASGISFRSQTHPCGP